MKKLALVVALAAASLTSIAVAQDNGDDMVCLITFSTPEEAAAGADDTALSGVYLPLEEAMDLAATSGGLSDFWDYSAQFPDNADEEAFCEGPTFNPDLDGDDGVPSPNSARDFAPGQLKGEGESARAFAPGQTKSEGESARDSAPGQQKKND
jgi:hypothetical protein